MDKNLNQITRALEKLFNAGFNTDKKIISMKIEDLRKIPNLVGDESLIIIDYREAVKNKDVTAYLSGSKGIEKGAEKK